MNEKILNKAKKVFLILLIFSLPFEYWDPFGIASFFTVTKMAGFGYAMMALFTLGKSFDLQIFKYVKYLIFIWLWLVILSMFNFTGINTVSIFNFTILQNIILYWLVASDLKKGNIKIKTLMVSFVFSIVLMSILLTLGIGLGQEYVEGVSRLTFFENNPNTVGILVGLAIVFSVYFIINPAKTFGKKGYMVLLAMPGFINLLLLSGSRGALITTSLSVGLLLLMNKTHPFKRILQIALLIAAGTYLMSKIVESDLMFKRLNQFVEDKDTAGRGEIWEDVVEISASRPIIGYGATGFETEMRRVYGGNKDSHNLFLYLLVTTGIIGLSVFLYFLYFHWRKAYQDLRKGEVLKLIMFIFYLTTVVKGGGIIKNKLMWVLLAIIFSASLIQYGHKNFMKK